MPATKPEKLRATDTDVAGIWINTCCGGKEFRRFLPSGFNQRRAQFALLVKRIGHTDLGPSVAGILAKAFTEKLNRILAARERVLFEVVSGHDMQRIRVTGSRDVCNGWQLRDRCDEKVSAFGDRLNVRGSVRVGLEGLSQSRDVNGQIAFLDYCVRPHEVEQIVLQDQMSCVANKNGEAS